MGVVWSGRDELLDRAVAVKEVTPPSGLDAAQRERLRERTLREARSAARISSSAAVTVFDVVEDDDRPWIVMELLPPRTLADMVRENGPLSPDAARQLGLRLLEALTAAHAAGVLHRDVKPSNVLHDAAGQAVLTDFGIASLEGDPSVTTTGTIIGSPGYVAPERAHGGAPSPASDMWSLGVTLAAAVHGRSPFERDTPVATLVSALQEPVPDWVVAGPLGEVITGLLDKDPARRLDAVRAGRLLRQAPADDSTAVIPRLAAVGEADAERTQALHLPAAAAGAGAAGAAGTGPAGADPAGADPGRAGEPGRSGRRSRTLPVLLLLAALVAVTGVVAAMTLYGSGGAGSTSPDLAGAEVPGTPPATAGTDDPAAGATAPGTAGTGAGEATAAAPEPGVASSAPAPSGSPEATAPPGFEPGTAPEGFVLHEDDAYRVAVPAGWTVEQESGTRTRFNDPVSRRYLLVEEGGEPAGDPVEDWRAQEGAVAQRLDGYELIGIDAVDYRGFDAADWQFTWEPGAGTVRVRNRAVVTDGAAFALYWQVPVEEFQDSEPVFDDVAASFLPAG